MHSVVFTSFVYFHSIKIYSQEWTTTLFILIFVRIEFCTAKMIFFPAYEFMRNAKKVFLHILIFLDAKFSRIESKIKTNTYQSKWQILKDEISSLFYPGILD